MKPMAEKSGFLYALLAAPVFWLPLVGNAAPLEVPTVTTQGDSPPEPGAFAGATGLPNNTIRLGDRRSGIRLPLPAPGRPYRDKVHIATLFETEETPVFNQDRFVPVSADITWQFAPARSPIVKTGSGH